MNVCVASEAIFLQLRRCSLDLFRYVSIKETCTSAVLWWADGLHHPADMALSLLIGCCVLCCHTEEQLLMTGTKRDVITGSCSVLSGIFPFSNGSGMIETHSIPKQEDVQTVSGILQLKLHQKDKLHQLDAEGWPVKKGEENKSNWNSDLQQNHRCFNFNYKTVNSVLLNLVVFAKQANYQVLSLRVKHG